MALPKKLADEGALYEYAVRALGRQMRSVAELKRLMRRRVAEGGEGLIDRVIARLKEQKYLNDSAFAASYSNYRRDNQRLGKMRVMRELQARGVHGDVVRAATDAAYEQTGDEQQARAYLKRKRLHKPSNQKEVARVFRTLLRAGFASRSVIAILKKWDVDEEVLSALETEEL